MMNESDERTPLYRVFHNNRQKLLAYCIAPQIKLLETF